MKSQWIKIGKIEKFKKTNIQEIQCKFCWNRFCDIVSNMEDFYKYCPSCGIKMIEE